MNPSAIKLSKSVRSSMVKPAFITFTFGRAISISLCATFRSPQKMTGLVFQILQIGAKSGPQDFTR